MAGLTVTGDKTRLFSMAYDNLLGRSRSYRQHNMPTGEMLASEAEKEKPLVHFYWLLRTPTAVNRPVWTGSHASRLLDYVDTDHCGKMIPLVDRQRIYHEPMVGATRKRWRTNELPSLTHRVSMTHNVTNSQGS
jgi:hypothetical protein